MEMEVLQIEQSRKKGNPYTLYEGSHSAHDHWDEHLIDEERFRGKAIEETHESIEESVEAQRRNAEEILHQTGKETIRLTGHLSVLVCQIHYCQEN